jgi:hypothetical protein
MIIDGTLRIVLRSWHRPGKAFTFTDIKSGEKDEWLIQHIMEILDDMCVYSVTLSRRNRIEVYVSRQEFPRVREKFTWVVEQADKKADKPSRLPFISGPANQKSQAESYTMIERRYALQ